MILMMMMMMIYTNIKLKSFLYVLKQYWRHTGSMKQDNNMTTWQKS